jgi:hypothetical protein
MLTDGLSGIRRHELSAKCLNHSLYIVVDKLFGAQIKPLQLVIIIYSNEAEKFGLHFFTVVVSSVDGEQVAFSNRHHSLGRQMTEHFMKYIHCDSNGTACEGI